MLVLAALFGMVGLNTVRADYQYPTAGAVRSAFSVSRDTKVAFSCGNLQYKASKNEWSFATSQYEIVGEANKSIGKNTYGGAIDLFGWGTGANPTMAECSNCSTTFEIMGPDNDNEPWDAGRRRSPMEYNDFIDWGTNPITNGGDEANMWRTLTKDEWTYLFFLRDQWGDRFSLGTVAGVKGVILLPDEWTLPPSIEFTSAQDAGLTPNENGFCSNINESNYDLNTFTEVQWQSMQDNGAVFLPAAGSRAETTCSGIGEEGFYWSSSIDDESTAFSLGFTKAIVAPKVSEPRASGQSVRLVFPLVEENPTGDEEEVNANFAEHPFTVADGKQVAFSQGNLQYQAKPDATYRFAPKQIDYIGEGNANIGPLYTGWIDLFIYDEDPTRPGNGTFAFGGELPPDEGFDLPARRNAPMGDEMKHINWDEVAISNAGNQNGIWYPLTADEWSYLFLSRENADDKFGFATVDEVKGLIILPDDWQKPEGCSLTSASSTMTLSGGVYSPLPTPAGIYETNKYYSTNQSWQLMEAAGAVFLPAAGGRSKTECNKLGESGFYWSNSSDLDNSEDNVFLLSFGDNATAQQFEFNPKESTTWDRGSSYRLVKDFEEEENHILSVFVNPVSTGVVKENGTQLDQKQMTPGATVTLTAEAVEGYRFAKWTLEGTGCSITNQYNSTTTFTMGTSDATLTAEFEVKPYTVTVVIDPTEGGEVQDANNEPYAGGEINSGDIIPLTAVAHEGYQFVNWTISSAELPTPIVATETTYNLTSNSDVTVTAHFVKTYKWSIWVNDENQGLAKDKDGNNITNTDLIVKEGDQVTLKAEAKKDYEFDRWEIRYNPDVVQETSYEVTHTFTVGNSNAYAIAYFKPIIVTHTLTVVVDPAEGGKVQDGYGIIVKDTVLEENEQITLTAIPNTGYTFAGWSIDNEEISSTDADYPFTMGTADVTLVAHFEAVTPTYVWSIAVNDENAGIVKDVDGIDITGQQILNLKEGDQVTLTAEAKTGYEFDYWFVSTNPTEAPVQIDGSANYTFTVGNSDATVIAHFKTATVEPEYTLSIVIVPAEGGKVKEGDVEITSATMKQGDTKTLTAVPNEGYIFAGWSISADNVSADAGYTFTMGTADVTLTANFTAVTVEHAWTEPTYTWTGDECTATRTWQDDPDHKETETVTATPSVTKEATCEEAGTLTYTATFTNAAFEAQTTNEPIPALGHDYGEPTYSWNSDNSECTGTRECSRDASHIDTEVVTTTSATTKQPTCDEQGEITYTATFTKVGFTTQTKTTPIIALGHDWQTPVYTWSNDHMTCTATQECGNDADHTHTITEVVTATVTKEGGEDVYTATFTNTVFETQTYRNTPSLDITISEFGFLSLYANKAYIVPQGLTAYIYTGMNGKNLVRENIDVIPAYTGVFFSGTPNKTYTLYETETQTTYPTNMLHGYLMDTKVDNPNVHYILSKNVVNGKPGLLWPLGTDKGVGEFTTRGGKAYLEIPVALGVAPRYYTMRGEACDEVTAVDETQVNGDGKYYDILGREVREPQPQQIYIHNGQKILYGE